MASDAVGLAGLEFGRLVCVIIPAQPFSAKAPAEIIDFIFVLIARWDSRQAG
jgi:hypothetical protein